MLMHIAQAQTVLLRFVACPMLYLQVTPSSKVVGDLAQFMVQNDLDEARLVEKASNLNLPDRSTFIHLLQVHCMFTAAASRHVILHHMHLLPAMLCVS